MKVITNGDCPNEDSRRLFLDLRKLIHASLLTADDNHGAVGGRMLGVLCSPVL